MNSEDAWGSAKAWGLNPQPQAVATTDLCVVGYGANMPIGATTREAAFAYRAGSAWLTEAPVLIQETGEAPTMALQPTLSPYLVGVERLVALARPAIHESLESLRGRIEPLRLGIYVLTDQSTAAPGEDGMAVAQRLALEIKQEVASLMGNAGGIEVDATDAAGLGQLLRRASPALGTKYSDALIVAVHTDCDPTRLNDLHRGHRIHAADNLDGLLLGEAAAALVLTSPAQLRATGRSSYLDLDTPEVLMDPARWDNDESSFKAGALTLAAKKCTDRHFQAGGRVGWVSTDVSFEMFRVHELQSVMARLQRRLGMPQVLDSPCQRIGNLGAATGVWQLAYAAEAIRRGFAPSREMLCLLGSDDGTRTALLTHAPS